MLERRSVVFTGLVLALGAGCGPRYDLVLRNGTLVDGTGSPAVVGDLAVRGDATGLIVAPGFFDLHSHSEYNRLLGQGASFSLQGITTEIFGEDASMGPVGGRREPDRYLGMFGTTAGWTSLGGFLDTLELDSMRSVVRTAMREGAIGISSGLSYVPDIYSSTAELTALAREAAGHGGIYATHIRTINGEDPGAVREAVAVADSAGIAVHFFHLNSVTSTNVPAFLGVIDSARARGLKLTADSYTYAWGITGLPDYIPSWAHAGGTDSLLARIADPSSRARIKKTFYTMPPYYAKFGCDKVHLGVQDTAINAKLVSEVAELQRKSPEDAYLDAVLGAKAAGIVIDWNNEEATLERVIAAPYVGGGTDGAAVDLAAKQQWPLLHPRMLGTMPRWIKRYAGERKLMTLEEAIRRLTFLGADATGLTDRGRLAVGRAAGVVAFALDSLEDRATFEDPHHYSAGMRYVLERGAGRRRRGPAPGVPGRALRGKGWVR